MLKKLITRHKIIFSTAILLSVFCLFFLSLVEGEEKSPRKSEIFVLLSRNPTLKEAYRLEKTGNLNEAITYYVTWLKNSLTKKTENHNEKIYYYVLNNILKIDPDVSRAMFIVQKYSVKHLTSVHRIEILNRVANLFELQGNFEKAKELYRIAWRTNPTSSNFNTLLDFLASLYTTGDFETVLKNLKKINHLLIKISSKDEIGRYYLIRGFTYLQTGNYNLAEKDFKYLLSSNAFPNQQEAARIGMYYSLKGQNKKGADNYFPKSHRIKLFPSPDAYFLSLIGEGIGENADERNVEKSSETAEKETAPENKNKFGKKNSIIEYSTLARGIYIQIGSFSSKENAYYLAKSLGKKGFHSLIAKTIVGEKLFFRVVVGPYGSIKESQQIIQKLKNSGFGGVIKEIR